MDDWLSLLKNKFCEDPGSCVAVHCVAGLGRLVESVNKTFVLRKYKNPGFSDQTVPNKPEHLTERFEM